MPSTFMPAWALAFVCCASACATQPPPAAVRPEPASSQATASGRVSLASQSELVGLWAEFWSPAGRADTQRFDLRQDGRFDWLAARGSEAPITRRSGQWSLDLGPTPAQLLLHVQSEDQRFGCEGSAACRVTHDPPVEQSLALGDCPDNEEARNLDPTYRCLSIDGRAFWRNGAKP
jgi:hypothetical protein